MDRIGIFKGFMTGVRAYGKAADILFGRKFRWFLLLPLVVVVVLFVTGNMLVSAGGTSLYGVVEGRVMEWVEGISWLQWTGRAVEILIKVVLKIFYFFLFATFGGYVVLMVMSPVYSWLSERAEAHLSGKSYPFSVRQFLWEIFRGVWIAMRNMVLQLLLAVLLFFCSFIPLVGLLVPFAAFFLSAYFYGFSFVDYVVERKRFNIREGVRYVNRNAGLVAGIGSVFALTLMIPWGNLVACCFVSLLSVVAATVALGEVEKPLANVSH